MIKLYYRDSPPCPYCTKAKRFLESREIKYDGVEIGKDISREEVIALFPNAKTVPIVLVEGTYIGGYSELYNYVTTNNVYGEHYGNAKDRF